jgi:methionyl-tRNA synthetase
MLISAGVPLPETLFVHGFINFGGTKVSKSLGNVVDPFEMVREYGQDAVRYFLLRGVNPITDTDFTLENFEARYNADLANDLGNLVNRTVSMIGRYRSGIIPNARGETPIEQDLQSVAVASVAGMQAAVDRYDPQRALDAVWELITRTNRYVEEAAPWTLSRAARQGDGSAEGRLDTALATLAESVRLISALLEPFIPDTAGQILAQLGSGESPGTWEARLQWGSTLAGARVGAARPLFPRLEAVGAS